MNGSEIPDFVDDLEIGSGVWPASNLGLVNLAHSRKLLALQQASLSLVPAFVFVRATVMLTV